MKAGAKCVEQTSEDGRTAYDLAMTPWYH